MPASPTSSVLEDSETSEVPNVTLSNTPTICCDTVGSGMKEKACKTEIELSTALNSSSKIPPEDSESQKESTAATTPISRARRTSILIILCAAEFFSIFNGSGSLISLPQISSDLQFSLAGATWILSAYTLTFASFMLLAGRLADMYHPKPVFALGFLIIGILSIPVGFSVNPVMAIVLRGFQGIGAAMNIPSAMALIRLTFTNRTELSRAYAIYGAFGAIGNVAGLVIGGVLTAFASWRWVYFILAMIMCPLAVISWYILPPHTKPIHDTPRGIDWPGVSALTAGLALFTYAIMEGSAIGWKSPRIIVTLILSIFLLAAFLVVERIVKDPAFPPRIWSNKNFTPLFFYACSVMWFINVSRLQLVDVFSTLWNASPLKSALLTIPMGIAAGISSPIVGLLAPKLPRKGLLIFGQLFQMTAVILFALADTESKYWSHVVPGMIVGMVGITMSYVGTTVVVMAGARSGEEGVVGAMMNTAFQTGATVGLAVATSIMLGVNSKLPLDPLSQHRGYEISFWSLLALSGSMILNTIIFVRD